MELRDKYTLLELAVNQANEPVVITSAELDQPGPRIIYVNEAFTRVTGYQPQEALGSTPRMLQGPATDRAMLDSLKEALEAGQSFTAETWNYRKDGTPYRIQWSISPVSLHGNVIDYFVSVQRDVTELYNTRKELESETKRINAILEAAGDAIVTTNDEGIICQFNPAAERMFGYSADNVIGSPLDILMPLEEAERHQGYMRRYERTGEARIIGIGREVEAVRADGSRFPIELNVTDTGLTNPRLFVGIMHDLTQRKQAEQERLHYYANFDPLTGLPNRHYTLTLIDEALERADHTNVAVGVIAVELAQLDLVSQGYGEKVGDCVIKQTTKIMRNRMGKEPCFIGNAGRGRFLVVVEGLEQGAEHLSGMAYELLEGIHLDMAGPGEGPEILVHARAGAALYPDDSTEAAALVGQAESALSMSLVSDAPALHMASEQTNERLKDRLKLEADLYRALENNEFFLLYQPQFALSSGTIVGSEALLRWQHPERGVVSPADFIPLLEETGLIEPVGEWLLNEAMEQGAAWSSEGNQTLRLAINLSPRQFRSGRLLQQVKSAISSSGFPKDRLELEITEGLLLENNPEIRRTLDGFKTMGIELALDDFGTGYSSLSYLHAFPLHTLKIDRTFVAGIDQSPKLEELLRGIFGLGHGLGMDIVAEGIETDEQLVFLRELGCPRGQGFGLAKPLTTMQFTQLLGS